MRIDDWEVREGHTEHGQKQLRGGNFDELLVGGWPHIERLDDDLWYFGIGDTQLYVRIAEDGKTVISFNGRWTRCCV